MTDTISVLRLYRLARGVSQTAVGKACHIPAAELGYMENGRLVPTEKQIAQLTEYFGVDAEQLFRRVYVHELLDRL